jgi:S1-C subfamily serine protease
MAPPKQVVVPVKRVPDDEDEDTDQDDQPIAKRPRGRSRKSGWLMVGGVAAGLVFIAAGTLGVVFLRTFWGGSSEIGGGIAAPKGFDTAQRAVADWLQDPEMAKRRAAEQKKDLLIAFTRLDTDPGTLRLANEVFALPEFQEGMSKSYIPVLVDSPLSVAGQKRVQDAARNEALKKEYQVNTYPEVVVADAQGRPYGSVAGYSTGDSMRYQEHLFSLIDHRQERDKLLAKAEGAQGAARLPAAKALLDWVQKNQLVGYYRPWIEDWAKLAHSEDPKNEQGYLEAFFEFEWLAQAEPIEPGNSEGITKAVAALDEWKKAHQFKDPNRAARIHREAGRGLTALGKSEQAAVYYKAGADYKPTDKKLARDLQSLARTVYSSSGTGFVIGTDGYILTNHHVISGPGRVVVRLPKVPDPVPGEVIALDEQHDMALVRIKPPKGAALKPLHLIADKKILPGEQVAALGYPLGDAIGSDVKLTTGVVTAPPDVATENLLLTEVKVNPGNSGGPLCDQAGNVVGMVSRKSFSRGGGEEGPFIESYGMALTAQELDAFLKKNLKDYKPAAAGTQKLAWNEVYSQVGPSVLMVLKTR